MHRGSAGHSSSLSVGSVEGWQSECSGLGPHVSQPTKEEKIHRRLFQCSNCRYVLCKCECFCTSCIVVNKEKNKKSTTNTEPSGNEPTDYVSGTNEPTDYVSGTRQADKEDKKRVTFSTYPQGKGSRPNFSLATSGRHCTTAECHGDNSQSLGKMLVKVGGLQAFQVGAAHSLAGVQTAVCKATSHVPRGDFLTSQRPGRGADSRRDRLITKQRGYTRGAPESEQTRLLQPLFSDQKETRRVSSYSGSQSTERLSERVQLQNVDERTALAHDTKGRLDGESGSERRLLSHRCIRPPQKIPAVWVPGTNLRVPGTTVRIITQSENVCEMYTSGTCASEESFDTSDSLHRRSVDKRVLAAGRARTHRHGDETPDFSGFHNKLRKELTDSSSSSRLYRHKSGLKVYDCPTVSGQTEVISVMFGTVSEREKHNFQNVHENERSHGVRGIPGTAGQAVYETFSEMDEGTQDTLYSSVSPRECHGGMYGGVASMERYEFSLRRSDYGGGYIQEDNHYGCKPHGVGCHPRGSDSQGRVECQAELLPHKLPGANGGVVGSATLPSFYPGLSRPGQDRQHNYDVLRQQTRRTAVPRTACASTQTDSMVRYPFEIDQGNSRSGSPEQRGGSAVQRDSPLWGMVPASRSNSGDLGEVWQASGGPVRLGGQHKVPSVLLRQGDGFTGMGCTGAPMAKGAALRVPPVISHLTHFGEGEDSTESESNPGGAEMGPLGLDYNAPPVRPAVGDPTSQGSANTGGRRDLSPSPRAFGSMGLAGERLMLQSQGLSSKVIDTMQGARAESTRSLYNCKWKVFVKWCESFHIQPFRATVSEVLLFLQELLEKGRAFSTIKVYLAAISACHMGLADGRTVGQHPLVCKFMKGARRERPVVQSLVPPWDLALVLDSLSRPPFEPLEEVSMKILSLKTALLLALSTSKRVSDLHALSANPGLTTFSAGGAKVVIKPNPAFVPKNPFLKIVPVDLEAFHPPPFSSDEDRRLHCLCPVRALKVYIDRSKTSRQSDQLFVSWDPRAVGKPITKMRLSRWLVEAIQSAYDSKGMLPPEGLRAHSTRGMAASWALCGGVSIQDVCTAASWSSPLTFVRFYRLDVTATPLAHAVLSVAPRQDGAQGAPTSG